MSLPIVSDLAESSQWSKNWMIRPSNKVKTKKHQSTYAQVKWHWHAQNEQLECDARRHHFKERSSNLLKFKVFWIEAVITLALTAASTASGSIFLIRIASSVASCQTGAESCWVFLSLGNPTLHLTFNTSQVLWRIQTTFSSLFESDVNQMPAFIGLGIRLDLWPLRRFVYLFRNFFSSSAAKYYVKVTYRGNRLQSLDRTSDWTQSITIKILKNS